MRVLRDSLLHASRRSPRAFCRQRHATQVGGLACERYRRRRSAAGDDGANSASCRDAARSNCAGCEIALLTPARVIDNLQHLSASRFFLAHVFDCFAKQQQLSIATRLIALSPRHTDDAAAAVCTQPAFLSLILRALSTRLELQPLIALRLFGQAARQ